MTAFTQIPASVTSGDSGNLSAALVYLANAYIAHMPKGTLALLNSDGTESLIKYGYYQVAQTPAGNMVRIYQIAVELLPDVDGGTLPVWKYARDAVGSAAAMRAPFL
jgi:hypothetical protein